MQIDVTQLVQTVILVALCFYIFRSLLGVADELIDAVDNVSARVKALSVELSAIKKSAQELSSSRDSAPVVSRAHEPEVAPSESSRDELADYLFEVSKQECPECGWRGKNSIAKVSTKVEEDGSSEFDVTLKCENCGCKFAT